MTDIEFLDLAENALKRIEAACDHINATTDTDIDNQRTGNMITLTFENRSQIIVNLQKPLQEIWLAAKRAAFIIKITTDIGWTLRGMANCFKCFQISPVSNHLAD